MPGHPGPRMNLALTLERAGRIDEAMATYDTALEVYSPSRTSRVEAPSVPPRPWATSGDQADSFSRLAPVRGHGDDTS